MTKKHKAGRPPVNDLVKKRVISDYKVGHRMQDIADRYGLHRITVNRILREADVPKRRGNGGKPKPPKKPKPVTIRVKIPRDLNNKIDNCKYSQRKLITALLNHYFDKIEQK